MVAEYITGTVGRLAVAERLSAATQDIRTALLQDCHRLQDIRIAIACRKGRRELEDRRELL